MRKIQKIGILIIIIGFIYSCENTEVAKLEKQVSELKLTNKKLRDSINNYDIKSIIDYQLTGFPVLNEYKVNETGKINVGLLKYGDIREHNVYQIIKGQKDKKLIYSNQTTSHFIFEFTPKSINDNEIELEMEFKANGGQTIVLPSKTHINVIK